MTTPQVSVIVVNWNGREHLAACFSSLVSSDYPPDRLELILVDNGSTDGSLDLMRSAFPGVRLVPLDDNLGFTGGNNAGVAVAHGDVLAFFNNDMRVQPGTISALVRALAPPFACVAARVLSWDGRHIDFLGGTVSFEGRGYQEHYGVPASMPLALPETFFPNGGAFAVTREAYEAVGGFDDRYFAYYDDIDLGWRLRLRGYGIRLVHDAVVHHRHGATVRKHPRGFKRFLMERNAVWNVMKNYGEETLGRVLGPIILLAAQRIAMETRFRRGHPIARMLQPFSARMRTPWARTGPIPASLVYGDADESPATPLVASLPVDRLAALTQAFARADDVLPARRAAQAGRTVPDSDIVASFGRPLEYASSASSYREAQKTLLRVLDLDRSLKGRPRLLIITHEPLGAEVSGPGIRVLEMGRALTDVAAVTIATPLAARREDRCAIVPYSFEDAPLMRRYAEHSDILLVQGFTLERFPVLTERDLPIVVDLYCPFTLEHLEMTRARGHSPAAIADDAAAVLALQNRQLLLGDFFICASERQRDFWIGALHTAGRVNPTTYADDPTLRSLIDVVPFGLPDEPLPPRTGPPVLKGAHPAIGPHDKVLLWGGSMLDWQDPQTLVRAVARLSAHRHDVKLFFMGTRHPNPQVSPMRAVEECRRLAESLGLAGTHVIFNDWVAYAERVRYLLEADLGLSTHREHLETRFSFRTRMLDYFWAGLPIVCTKGDHFAALVEQQGLGLTVPPGDEEALAAAIERLLDDDAFRNTCRERIRALAPSLTWSKVVEPLREYCAHRRFAADREPAMRALRDRLERSFRVSKWIKRTAFSMGLSESAFERVKQWPPVEAGMRVRNRLARARADRDGR